MTDYTIAQEYTLPSEGKVYSTDVNPHIVMRSMTTVEEMKRLNHSDRPHRVMSEIMDDCLVEKIGISAYDLCVPDFQYMLHKLRVVTYGPNYKVQTSCPYCGALNNDVINLDNINVTTFDKDVYEKYSNITLPSTKKQIKIRMQTPRMLDEIKLKTKEYRKNHPDAVGDPAFLFTLQALMETIDGEKHEEFRTFSFVQKLNMMDANYLLRSAEKLNNAFGLDSKLQHECNVCGLDYTSNFRTTSEFFGPTID